MSDSGKDPSFILSDGVPKMLSLLENKNGSVQPTFIHNSRLRGDNLPAYHLTSSVNAKYFPNDISTS